MTTALLITFFISLSLQFTIEVQPNERLCYYETMKVGERLLIGYQVHDGPDFEIDFYLYEPAGAVIEQNIKSSGNEKTVDVSKEGKYEFCFLNQNTQLPSKLISFYLLKDTVDENKNRSKKDPLEKELQLLKDGLRAVKEEQQYIVVRERNTAESTNSRVMWWSLFESCVLIAVCLWQVWYLKRFFEVKRAV